MPWYTPQEPPAALAEILSCTWVAAVEGTHRLVPDGCADLLWLSSGAGWLCGPETRAWTFQLPAGTTAVGIRFRPGLVGAVLRLDVAELTNRRVRLDELFGSAAYRRLAGELAERPEPAQRLATLATAVGRWAALGSSPDPLARLVAAGPFSASSLAGDLGLTPRQVHRRSLRAFGYGPSTLGRLMRLQRFLRVYRHHPNLARAAATVGYSDQSHLVRDCRAITGLAPGELLAEWFPTFPGASDPYKTGQTVDVTITP